MSSAESSNLYDAKVDFSNIYNQPDPRHYYRVLGELGYEIPAHGTAPFELLLDELGGRDGKTVLDLCCSYGVNAALLNYDVELAELFEHYAGFDASAPSEALMLADAAWFGERRRDDAVSLVGFDAADRAVHYATAVGLLDRGLIGDLENEELDAAQADVLGTIDLVTVTGAVGYIGEQTFRTVVEAAGDDPPWIAALSLRWVDYAPIAEALGELGMVTEQVEGFTVPQRRFASPAERDAALAGLRSQKLDPGPELDLGGHCAQMYVSRTPEAVRDKPIDQVFAELLPS
ncbi:MAG TPA: class I SAM-dependent methyltransferase [Mycobacteriales bacterium]|nr:class I SAM-dependent methyltransferase [Mycobacteriales bacterium]